MWTWLLSLSLSFAAEQATSPVPMGLHWAPDEPSVHYRVRSSLASSEPLDTGQPTGWTTFDATLACDATTTPSRVTLRCDLGDVRLVHEPMGGQGTPEASPAAGALDGAEVVLSLSRRGQLRSVDLEVGEVPGWVRPMVTRALAGFDLLLPPSPGTRTWQQQQMPWLQPRAADGPLARGAVTHRNVASDGTLVSIDSTGSVHQTFFDVALRPDDDRTLRLVSDARFDARDGVLAERTWTVSSGSEGAVVQTARLTRHDVREGVR